MLDNIVCCGNLNDWIHKIYGKKVNSYKDTAQRKDMQQLQQRLKFFELSIE
jgi:hypothetical protein